MAEIGRGTSRISEYINLKTFTSWGKRRKNQRDTLSIIIQDDLQMDEILCKISSIEKPFCDRTLRINVSQLKASVMECGFLLTLVSGFSSRQSNSKSFQWQSSVQIDCNWHRPSDNIREILKTFKIGQGQKGKGHLPSRIIRCESLDETRYEKSSLEKLLCHR